MTRSTALAAASCALLALASPASAQQLALANGPGEGRAVIARESVYVDAIVRLEIAGGPSQVVPALARDTVLLLPFTQFFEMAGIIVVAFELRDSAVVMLEPGHVPLRFRPTTRELTRGGVAVPHDTADVVWWDGDLFIATTLLDGLLGVRTAVEWANLSALVGRSDGLPVVARARREQMRRLWEARHRPSPDVFEIQLRERPVDGAVLAWSFTATGGAGEQTALELGAGTGLFSGSAELRPVFWSNQAGSGASLRASWSRAWTTGWLRQASVGDVRTGGRRAILMQGFTLTNAPFIRSSEFDVEQFVGKVPSGWEVEFYDRGQLLAYGGADAYGTFRVPLELRYGQNPFELVMYGPGGELVRHKRTIRVPFSRIPDGRIEYAVGAGRCRYDPCDALLSADLRYGLSNRVTLQGGWDAFAGGPRGSLWQPYALVSAAPLPSVGVTGEAVVNGHVRIAADYEPHIDLRASAAHARYARSGVPAATTVFTASSTEGSLYWRPPWRNGTVYFQGAGVLSSGPTMGRNLERVSASMRAGQTRYGLGILHDELRISGRTVNRRFTLDASVDAILGGPWSVLRNAYGQAQLGLDPGKGLSAWRVTLGRPVARRRLRLDAGLGWFRGTGFSLELNLTSAMAGPRFGTRSRLASGAGSEAMVFANGAVAFDPRTQLLRLGDQGDLGKAGVTGVLFRDDNSNGRREPGEPGISGIPVRVGGWPSQTDSAGRFSAWGMFPTEPVRVQVDSLSFDDPHLLLPAPVIQVRPRPNSFGAIEVPVVVGAEVGGYVVLGAEPVAGVPVLLRELNTGAEISIITFADGGFYRGAVPPGEYEVTLPEALLERLNALAPPLSIFVPPGTGDKRFTDLHLRLERRE